VRIIVLAFFILLLFSGVAGFCKEESAAGAAEWNPLSLGPITTWTAPLCGKNHLVVQPFFYYNKTRGEFDNDGHSHSLPKGGRKHQYQYQLFAQYGITDRLEINGQAVYQTNYARQSDNSARKNGMGDSYMFLRYCMIEERKWIPHTTPIFQLKLPTGKYQKLDPDKLGTDNMGATSGGGSYDHGYGLLLTKKMKPFLFHADAIYNFPTGRKVDGLMTRYGQYLNYDFGVEYFLPKGFNLLLEFNGFAQGDKKESGSKIPSTDKEYFVAAPGIGWSCEKIQTLVAYQRTLAGTNTDANDSIVFSFVYTF